MHIRFSSSSRLYYVGLFRKYFPQKNREIVTKLLKLNCFNFLGTTRSLAMVKDLFIIDTRCQLNKAIKEAFDKKGYEVHVSYMFKKD